jgi:lipopolysaccharide export system protein LptA
MSRQFFRNSLLFTAAIVLMTGAPGGAQPEKAAREAIEITSKRMEADKLADKVAFTGSVTLKKAGMTLSSDSMIVHYDAGSKNIRKIEAHGNVVVRKEGRVARSDHASYLSREEKIVLTGNAHIIENENQLSGEKITLFMRDDRSIVEGGKVLLYQETQEKPKEKPAGDGERK